MTRRAGVVCDALAVRVHLDTDLGGDIDDACALAMVLGWDDAELVAVTTNLDDGGQRAGCVGYVLDLVGREDVPVASGAGASLTTLQRYESTWNDARYWPEPVRLRPSPAGDALSLLSDSIAGGATVVAIGAYTNLALLEVVRPGALDGVRVVVMGGWIRPPGAELPQWGPDRDWNVQSDVRAAEILMSSGADLTLVPLSVTLRAHLRAAHLTRLHAAGAVGALLAHQAEAYAADHQRAALGQGHPALPDDLLNFQHDPVACAVALGWPGAVVDELVVVATIDDGVLRLHEHRSGRPIGVLVDLDADAFANSWLRCIEATARHR